MAGAARRLADRRARRRRAADRSARHRAVRDVAAHDPAAAAAVHGRTGPVAQPVSAGGVEPDAARARHHARAQAAEVALRERLPDRDHAVRAVRRAAQGRARRQRPGERAAAARRDDGRLRRRHAAEGQERLVLDDVPAAAGPADLRPDPVRARRQQPLPAVRRMREELLRLQPARRLSRRPQRRRLVLERSPARLRRRLPRPRARVLHSRRRRLGDGRERARLHGGQRRELLGARLVRQGLVAHADHALRRARVLPLLLARGAGAGRRGRRARGGGLGAARAARSRWRSCGCGARSPRRSRSSSRSRARRPRRRGAALRSLTRHRAVRAGEPEVEFVPEGKRVVAVAGADAARGRRGAGPADRVRLPDGRLRRRPGGRARRRRAPVGDLRRRALDARTARAGRQHPDGVLRARQRPGAHVADAREGRSSSRSAASTASPTTARSSGSSSWATASPASRPPITCAAGIPRARSTSSPTSRTSSTTGWASPG